jgi:hypothetical protein
MEQGVKTLEKYSQVETPGKKRMEKQKRFIPTSLLRRKSDSFFSLDFLPKNTPLRTWNQQKRSRNRERDMSRH